MYELRIDKSIIQSFESFNDKGTTKIMFSLLSDCVILLVLLSSLHSITQVHWILVEFQMLIHVSVFCRSNNTQEELGELAKTANPDAIDIDDDFSSDEEAEVEGRSSRNLR